MASCTGRSLTDAAQAQALLSAAQTYHETGKWWCHLLLLMPDHVHAMLVFPSDTSMSAAIRDWKRATARLHGISWQENYFDHRIRNEEESSKTWAYIRRNPVVKELCATEDDWPFWWSGTVGEDRGP